MNPFHPRHHMTLLSTEVNCEVVQIECYVILIGKNSCLHREYSDVYPASEITEKSMQHEFSVLS